MNTLPMELMLNVASDLSLRDMACVASTCKLMYETFQDIIDLLFLEVNTTLRNILDVISESCGSPLSHKVTFVRYPYVCKVCIRYPARFRFVIQYNDYSINELTTTAQQIKKHTYFNSVNMLMQCIRSSMYASVIVMNTMIFPTNIKHKVAFVS